VRSEFIDVEIGPSIHSKTISNVYQYDKGLKLRLSGLKTARIVQIQYAVDGMKETITHVAHQENEKWVAPIPDEALERGNNVNCYVYITDSYTGLTVYHVILAVTKRVKPDSYGRSVDYTCPNLQMYAGDTTTWEIVLYSERNISFTHDQLAAFAFTLTLVSKETNETVLTKAGTLIEGQDGTVRFSFTYSDTINLEGDYLYQIEMKSEVYCKSQQGELTIFKNLNAGGE